MKEPFWPLNIFWFDIWQLIDIVNNGALYGFNIQLHWLFINQSITVYMSTVLSLNTLLYWTWWQVHSFTIRIQVLKHCNSKLFILDISIFINGTFNSKIHLN